MFGRPNFEETIVRWKDWTFRVRPELSEQVNLLASRLFDPGARKEARLVKETGGRRSIWTMPLLEAGVPLAFVKHYSRPRLAKQIKHLFRDSRSRQEWKMGRSLEELGLPVARHLLLAERTVGGLLQEDFLVQEALVGYQNFDQWFREEWEEVSSGAEVSGRRRVIQRLAALIRELHDQGVLQRDFKPDSIMVGPQGGFKLVDLERALIIPWPGGLPLFTRLDNLAKIDQTFGFIGSVTDRLRFLRAYFQDRALSRQKLHEYARTVSHLAELKFRKRARERRVWTSEDNTTYAQFHCRGFRVSAHRSLSREMIASVIAKIDSLTGKEVFGPVEREGLYLRGVWCDARTALAHSPSLYYRKVPFIPARAAIYPGRGPWGLLLFLDPRPELLPWQEAAKQARERGEEMTFAADLGRVLRVFHRMGITYRNYIPDSLLYDPQHENPWLRFYLNRLDLLLLDRSPSPHEVSRILERIAELLALSPQAHAEMKDAYHQCRRRWFRAPDRW